MRINNKYIINNNFENRKNIRKNHYLSLFKGTKENHEVIGVYFYKYVMERSKQLSEYQLVFEKPLKFYGECYQNVKDFFVSEFQQSLSEDFIIGYYRYLFEDLELIDFEFCYGAKIVVEFNGYYQGRKNNNNLMDYTYKEKVFAKEFSTGEFENVFDTLVSSIEEKFINLKEKKFECCYSRIYVVFYTEKKYK